MIWENCEKKVHKTIIILFCQLLFRLFVFAGLLFIFLDGFVGK